MTQSEFQKKLAKGLSRLPVERRREIEEDIANHFAEGLADGVEEETLSEMLGAPEALAKEYLMQSALGRAQEKPTVSNVFRVIWAGLGLGMLNLMFALPVLMVIFAVWITFASIAVGCLVGGVAAVLSVPLYVLPFVREMIYIEYLGITFCGGLAIAALGGLAGIFSVWLGRHLLRGLLQYVKAQRDIIIGRRKEA